MTGFVVDTTRPVITEATPIQNSLVTPTSGIVQVSFAVSENLDPTTLTSANITAVRSGGDGVFGAGGTIPDVPLTVVSSSIHVTYLHTPKGGELVTFDVAGATANDSYQVNLGPGLIDIAGNPIVGNDGAGANYVINFSVFDPTLSKIIYVASPATTNGAGSLQDGSFENPYNTIAAGLNAANVGDTVAVLPGVYDETVVLKAQVRLVSADPTSTDTNIVPGNPLQTIIRPDADPFGNFTYSVVGNNLTGIPGIPTEIAGFSIASPLGNFDPARGPIVIGSTGINLNNSDVLVDRNYILDNYYGVNDVEGPNTLHSQFQDNVFVGNTYGLIYNSAYTLPADTQMTPVVNNTFAFNLFGIYDIGFSTSPMSLEVANNIFWQNDRQQVGGGSGIAAMYPGKIIVVGNMFSVNGADQASPADDALNVGGGFDPSVLSAKPDAGGNFVGNPAFVAPRDPRGQFDGPAVFFREGNFDLTVNSAAIDSAINSLAPTVDLLGRGRVKIAGRGVPYGGPADVGAFEYHPATGGTVVTPSLTSINAQAADQIAAGFTLNAAATPAVGAAVVPAAAASVAPVVATTIPTTPAPAAPPVSVAVAVHVTPPPAAAPVTVHKPSHVHHAVVRKVLSALKRSKKH